MTSFQKARMADSVFFTGIIFIEKLSTCIYIWVFNKDMWLHNTEVVITCDVNLPFLYKPVLVSWWISGKMYPKTWMIFIISLCFASRSIPSTFWKQWTKCTISTQKSVIFVFTFLHVLDCKFKSRPGFPSPNHKSRVHFFQNAVPAWQNVGWWILFSLDTASFKFRLDYTYIGILSIIHRAISP